MSFSNDNVLVVIGSGPGIGRAVATLFASKAQRKIALISRSPEKLEQDRAAVDTAARQSGRSVDVKTWAVDITHDFAFVKVLAEVEDFGVPEMVLFNASRVVPSTLMGVDFSEIEYDFKITTTALHTAAKWAIPRLTKLSQSNPQSRPSLLVTNSFLYKDPIPQLFSLSVTKSAQRTLVLSMAKEFGTEGVHIGLVSIRDPVAPTNKKASPGYIAGQVWEMYRQTSPGFSVDVEITETD